MSLSVTELIDALPEPAEADDTSHDAASDVFQRLSLRPAPVGRLRRLGLLGTLKAKIAAAYVFHWLRGWFKSADENKRLLAETHWRTAVRVLDSMSYLRGAVMKVGQTLANFPDIVPREFVETLEQLHCNAPPMHWSLLREMVHNELGDDPENLFAGFDKHAFAAASLGQVHSARLASGDELAVKIQYPGIARTISDDFRNLLLFLLPNRLNRDWDCMKDQFDDLRLRMEHETDYEREAAMLAKARTLFRDVDQIVIPRVYPQLSSSRVLTMERLPGVHLDEFLTRNPSQELCNEFARKISLAWYRLMYSGRMLYCDAHPGNFLFMDDGRLGVIDFGNVLPMDDELWEHFRKFDRPLTTGRREDRIAVLKDWSWLTDDPVDALPLKRLDEFAEWCWRGRAGGGEFDFGQETEFRRGVDLFISLARTRFMRGRPTTFTMNRCQFGFASILYRLKAKFDLQTLAEQEVRATGWDRSDYAPQLTS